MADIGLHVAVQVEPDVSVAELNSRPEADRALQRIRHAAAVDFVIGHLRQPIPIETKPYVLAHFVGCRVVNVKRLSRLHVSDAEAYKRIVVG